MTFHPINKSLFVITDYSSELLPQLRESALKELESDPISFKALNQINRNFELGECDFEFYFPEAIKVLNNEIFQDFPGSLRRLIPPAGQYQESFAAVKGVLSKKGGTEELLAALRSLVESHKTFENSLRSESQMLAPAAPSTVLSRYPNALRLYFSAFLHQLAEIRPETYAIWKGHSESISEEAIELFPRLAIHHLLKVPTLPIPELFMGQQTLIEELREEYKALTPSKKNALIEQLRFEAESDDPEVRALFLKIGKLKSDLETRDPRIFSGVIRMVHQEASIAFTLLDQMDLRLWPANVEYQFRSVFLALLKQEGLTTDQLPYDLSGRAVASEVLFMHGKYQNLDDEEKARFDAFFLSEGRACNEKKLKSLILDWEKVYWHWSARPLFPFHLLAKISFEQRRAI